MKGCIFGAFVVTLVPTACAQTGMDRASAWRADLQYLAAELPARHPDFFHRLAREDFRRAVEELREDIPKLDDDQITIRLAQLVALAGDSHTSLDPVQDPNEARFFPFGLYWFEDGMRVLKASTPHERLIGARLQAVDDVPIERVISSISSLIPAENQAILKKAVPHRIPSADILHALGITRGRGKATFTFVLEDGSTAKETLEAVDRRTMKRLVTFAQRGGYQVPLYLRSERDPYWMHYLEPSRTLFIQYNKCMNKKSDPFQRFSVRALALAKRRGAERLVIDLRHNGGGNSAIADPFIRKLAKHEVFGKRGRLFVIIGRRTFSSALMNAVRLHDGCGAILVGEETGGKPDHFGEVRSFKLPHSKFVIHHSTKFFRMRKGDDRPTLQPDVRVVPTWSALAAGRDPALEACLVWSDRS